MIWKIILAIVALGEFDEALEDAQKKDICRTIIHCTIILAIALALIIKW